MGLPHAGGRCARRRCSGGSASRSSRASGRRGSTAARWTRTATTRPAARRCSRASRRRDEVDVDAQQHRRLRRSRDPTSRPRLLANVAAPVRELQRLRRRCSRASSRRAISRSRASCSAPRPATGSARRDWARSTSARWSRTSSAGCRRRSASSRWTTRPRSALGAKPLKEETSVNLSAGRRRDAGREPHADGRLLRHPDQRPHPARRHVRRRSTTAILAQGRASPTSAACSTSRTASTPGRRAWT